MSTAYFDVTTEAGITATTAEFSTSFENIIENSFSKNFPENFQETHFPVQKMFSEN